MNKFKTWMSLKSEIWKLCFFCPATVSRTKVACFFLVWQHSPIRTPKLGLLPVALWLALSLPAFPCYTLLRHLFKLPVWVSGALGSHIPDQAPSLCSINSTQRALTPILVKQRNHSFCALRNFGENCELIQTKHLQLWMVFFSLKFWYMLGVIILGEDSHIH